MVRASSGVAISNDSSSQMRRILATCCAFESASLPLPMYSESSSPTRTLSPSSAACVVKFIWCRPAATPRENVVLSEQLCGGVLHVDEMVKVGANASQDPEDELQKDWRLQPPAIVEVLRIVQVPHVIALVLELHSAFVG